MIHQLGKKKNLLFSSILVSINLWFFVCPLSSKLYSIISIFQNYRLFIFVNITPTTHLYFKLSLNQIKFGHIFTRHFFIHWSLLRNLLESHILGKIHWNCIYLFFACGYPIAPPFFVENNILSYDISFKCIFLVCHPTSLLKTIVLPQLPAALVILTQRVFWLRYCNWKSAPNFQIFFSTKLALWT